MLYIIYYYIAAVQIRTQYFAQLKKVGRVGTFETGHRRGQLDVKYEK